MHSHSVSSLGCVTILFFRANSSSLNCIYSRTSLLDRESVEIVILGRRAGNLERTIRSNVNFATRQFLAEIADLIGSAGRRQRMPGITLQMATDRDSVALEIEGVDVVEGHVERRQDVFTYREVAVAGEFAVGNDQAEASQPPCLRNR